MRRVTFVVADRHPVFVCGLLSLFGSGTEFRVLATCHDGGSCIEAIRSLSPDIALVEFWMPTVAGLDILAAVTSENLRTRIVLLADHADDRDLITAVARGAHGVLFKHSSPAVLMQGLRQVADGRRSFPLANGNGKGSNGGALTALTEREREIMHLVSEGLSNKEVGRQLNISDGTIKVHLHHIYQKLAISNRTALAALAFTRQDSRPPDG